MILVITDKKLDLIVFSSFPFRLFSHFRLIRKIRLMCKKKVFELQNPILFNFRNIEFSNLLFWRISISKEFIDNHVATAAGFYRTRVLEFSRKLDVDCISFYRKRLFSLFSHGKEIEIKPDPPLFNNYFLQFIIKIIRKNRMEK